MRRSLRTLAVLAAAAATSVVTAGPASAEVEPGGWISTSPGYAVQERGCGQVDGLTFRLTCSTASGDQRAERRYDTYTGGSRQFEGYFRIDSMSGTRISLKQTFHESGSGAYFMLAAERGGRLYAVHGGDTLSNAGTIGATVRVNTVHDVGSQHRTYINGSRVHTYDSPGGSFYDKFGAYRTDSGQGPATVVWSGVQFWRR
ncbi:hypothetical protein [Streptomyces sp. SBT349]|uniref:hypothetical protein n=1 Tax=Streptomyces sp. SBT349 TaxID=1580539 RepID=UPI00066EB540|nr:hypothetical protein [Streptomyces sp. SBT349]